MIVFDFAIWYWNSPINKIFGLYFIYYLIFSFYNYFRIGAKEE